MGGMAIHHIKYLFTGQQPTSAMRLPGAVKSDLKLREATHTSCGLCVPQHPYAILMT